MRPRASNPCRSIREGRGTNNDSNETNGASNGGRRWNGRHAEGISSGWGARRAALFEKDLGVILCDVPASAAAVYTQSHFQAAPLKVTQASLAVEQKLQAVIVNSACANACTGEQGLKDAYEMRELCAKQFGLALHHVAVASTGVIGEYLPMEKIRAGIEKLVPGATMADAEAFQTAILTTDTVMKRACYQTTVDGKTVTVGGRRKDRG